MGIRQTRKTQKIGEILSKNKIFEDFFENLNKLLLLITGNVCIGPTLGFSIEPYMRISQEMSIPIRCPDFSVRKTIKNNS